MGKYQEQQNQFAAVCKKWGIPKGEGAKQLFFCFQEIAYYIHMGQYEKQDYGLLETAKLIRLLDKGRGIKVSSSNGGEVSLQNPILLAELYMYLNTALQVNSMGLYHYTGLARNKKQIKEGSTYKGVVFGSGEFTEPYTEEELQKIVAFEEGRQQWELQMQGKAGAGIPKIGFFVQKFLVQAPELFGYYYCYTGPNGEALKPALQPTEQYNLIGELLEVTGVLEQFKGALWLQNKWAFMNNSERRKEVEGWLKSYENAEKKRPASPILYLEDSRLPQPDKHKTGRQQDYEAPFWNVELWNSEFQALDF